MTPKGVKVVSRAGVNNGGRERILRALREAWPDYLQRKQLAVHTNLKPRYVGKLLPEMARLKEIVSPYRGWFTINAPPGPSVIRIENLTLVAKGVKVTPRGGEEKPLAQTHLDKRERPLRVPNLGGLEGISEYRYFRSWSVYVQRFDNGTTEAQLGTHGQPGLTLPDLLAFVGWIEGTFPDIPIDGPTGWKAGQLELNADYQHLTISKPTVGGKAVSLKVLPDVIMKIYSKDRGTRIEFRKTSETPMAALIAIAEEVFTKAGRIGLVDAKDILPFPNFREDE
jgi:hypothetical protein